ncbi:hypothetical protein ACS0TY_015623 [Phlomoides rotata]
MSDLVEVRDEDCKNQLRMDRATFYKLCYLLQSIGRLHYLLLGQPQPVPEDSTDPIQGKFKGCLGALDGTFIDVNVPTTEKGRYRNRKGQVFVNVLGLNFCVDKMWNNSTINGFGIDRWCKFIDDRECLYHLFKMEWKILVIAIDYNY